MPLYGAGYNRLGAVTPSALVKGDLCREIASSSNTTYYDIFTNATMHEVKAAGVTFSIIQADQHIYFFGRNPMRNNTETLQEGQDWHRIVCDKHPDLQSLGLEFVGNCPEELCAVSEDGELLWFSRNEKQCSLISCPRAQGLEDIVTHIAIRQWGHCIAIACHRRNEQNEQDDPAWQVYEFDSLLSFKHWYQTGVKQVGTAVHTGRGTVQSLVGGSSAFVMSLTSGEVLSWGVPFRNWELGRVPDQAYPAEIPRILDGLAGIPIRKVVASYDLYCAISEYNDLYLWGKPSENSRSAPFKLDEYKELVSLVDLGDGVNVVDVGIGGHSIVCVTEDGRVFRRGHNTDGQLFSANLKQTFDTWEEIPNMTASRVACSLWTTFLW